MIFLTKKLLNSKIKRFFILFLLLIIYIIISAFFYTNAVCSNIADNVFRLHVIANSDSPEDQNLKYIVRDSIINYINSMCPNAKNKDEVISFANSNIEKLTEIANKTILDNGFNYTATVKLGNFAFPTKEYGDISLPPGLYDALKVEIGNADGQNWWCVMFPPLCFVDVTSGIVPEESKIVMEENLSKEEYKLISESSKEVEFKFKIVELLQNFTLSGIFM